MPDSPSPKVNLDTYAARMDAVRDKLLLADLLRNGDHRVLDYGCGTGVMADFIAEELYLGYEPHGALLDVARTHHPDHRFVDALPEAQTYDCVILSSVLHEIYSYGWDDESENPRPFERSHVVTFLQHIHSLLAPGGHVVVRDGVIPELSLIHVPASKTTTPCVLVDEETNSISLDVVDPDDMLDLLYVLHENDNALGANIDGGTLRGPVGDVLTTLNVATWGWASVPRESRERVNAFTVDEWTTLVVEAGFKVTWADLLDQPDYIEHLSAIAYLDEGVSWPTKIILDVEPR